jgi:hypothetical protein
LVDPFLVINRRGTVLSAAILLGFADSKNNDPKVGWSAGGGETPKKISGCSTQPTNKPWPMLEPSPFSGQTGCFLGGGWAEN